VLSRLDQHAFRHPLALLGSESLAIGKETCEPDQTPRIIFIHHGRTADTPLLANDDPGIAPPHVPTRDPGQMSERCGQRPVLAKHTDLRCVDCGDEITFSRRSDFDRHTRIKHPRGYNASFVCSAQGCFRGQVPWSFVRSDKLTSHIKITHHQNTIFSQCPIEDCSFGQCTLETMGVHIQRVHPDESKGRAVLNATSCRTLRCPIWRCGKYFSAVKLLHHVTTHAREDIEAANQSLDLLGLLVQSTHGCAVTIQVICPICHAVSATVEQSARHLTTEHLYTPQSATSEHFEKWKAYLRQNSRSHLVATVNKLLPWSSFDDFYKPTAKRAYGCPSCPFSVTGVERFYPGSVELEREQIGKRTAIREHHLSFLRPGAEVVKELYPYRMQILRLWPEFASHPVFADLDQPQQQSRVSLSEVQPLFPEHVNHDSEFPDWTAHDYNQPQQQSENGPSEVRSSFASHINDDFEICDWTTYDFNASMGIHDNLPNGPLTGHQVQPAHEPYNKTGSTH
jgi:hypothetical protein